MIASLLLLTCGLRPAVESSIGQRRRAGNSAKLRSEKLRYRKRINAHFALNAQEFIADLTVIKAPSIGAV
jgi:hypothetical protein